MPSWSSWLLLVRWEPGTGTYFMPFAAEALSISLGADCVVYIRGVIDRFHEFIAAHCPHQTFNFGEIVGEVVSYLEDHPSERDQAASDLVLKSLMERVRVLTVRSPFQSFRVGRMCGGREKPCPIRCCGACLLSRP